MSIIIGLVGSFGSGCSVIGNKFISPLGYKYISLTKILREYYAREKGSKPTDKIPRRILQDFGNEIREKNGPSFLAEKAIDIIKDKPSENFIIDSIKNPAEIDFLKNEIPEVYIIGIFADIEIRWDRLKDYYKNDRSAFDADNERDANENVEHGQKVSECFKKADIIISNDKKIHRNNEAETLLKAKIKHYIDLIEKKESFKPNQIEAIMAMAYANSLRSSCLKRKVGAILIDDYGNIFSSGYNEVPKDQKPCKEEYGMCYRDLIKNEVSNVIDKIVDNTSKQVEINKVIKNNYPSLDSCRSLHAEENAILNVARFGGSIALNRASIYTTTYPCLQCSNKIVKVGIKRVVFLEPYQKYNSKEVLDQNEVEQESFEGVLFNGYFRL